MKNGVNGLYLENKVDNATADEKREGRHSEVSRLIIHVNETSIRGRVNGRHESRVLPL